MSEIRGIGVDLCAVSRFREMEAQQRERFLSRWFTSGEIAYIHDRGAAWAESMAGCYAAKEAFLKALGTGITLPLQAVEVIHHAGGQPGYRLTGQAAEMTGQGRVHLSISHDGDMAMAFCIIENKA